MPFHDVFNELSQDESYRFITDRILNAVQSKSFLMDSFTDIHAWREEARKFVMDKLHYSPEKVPFHDMETEEVDFGEYTRKKIYFDSASGCRIPAYFLVPKGLKEPAPGIIALHDHGAMFYWGKDKSVEHKEWNPVLKKYVEGYYSGLPVASGLAARGYAVLVIDSLFFGERSYKAEMNDTFARRLKRFEMGSEEYINEYNNISIEVESALVRTLYYAGQTFMGIRTWDDMASVSYLCSRPEVDSDRIGCIGLSMGGQRSGWLSAMDDRIKCAVVVGWMARYKEMLEHRLPYIPWMWTVPGLYGSLDYPDVVSISAPKPLMVMHGKQDWLYPHETGEQAIELIRKVYAKAKAEANFTAEIFDVPHEFNEAMQERAYSWMDKCLKV